MYDPTQGRFITEDPIGFEAGDPNTYRYVGNSPTNATDPSGFWGRHVHEAMTNMLAAMAGYKGPTALGTLANDPDTGSRSPVPAWLTNVFTQAFAKIVTLNGSIREDIQKFVQERANDLSFWHFPVNPDGPRKGIVDPGSDAARSIARIGIEGERNKLTAEQALWFFGEGLHVLQDSYSHWGTPVNNGFGHDHGWHKDLYWVQENGKWRPRWVYDHPSSGLEAALSSSADDERLYRQAAIDAGMDTWRMLMEFRKAYPQFFGPFPGDGHEPTEADVRKALGGFFPK